MSQLGIANMQPAGVWHSFPEATSPEEMAKEAFTSGFPLGETPPLPSWMLGALGNLKEKSLSDVKAVLKSGLKILGGMASTGAVTPRGAVSEKSGRTQQRACGRTEGKSAETIPSVKMGTCGCARGEAAGAAPSVGGAYKPQKGAQKRERGREETPTNAGPPIYTEAPYETPLNELAWRVLGNMYKVKVEPILQAFRNGFPAVGFLSAKGPDAPREQVCCECELLSNPRQKWERAIESRKLVPEDDAVEIWNQAMLEVDKGWLIPPTLANDFDWSSTVPNVRLAQKTGRQGEVL